MLAWRDFQDSIHQACGQPLERSTHPYMEGWYDPDDLICWACTAMAEPDPKTGVRKPVVVPGVIDTRDHDHDPLPPLPLASPT